MSAATMCGIAAVAVLGDAVSDEPAARAPLRTVLADRWHAGSAQLVSGMYVTLPMIAVQAFMPALLLMYAMADRLTKYASIAFLLIHQFFQSWVPDPRADFRHRARVAAAAAVGIDIVAGTFIATLSPWASGILSVGKISVLWQVLLPLGVASVGYACLVAVGRVRALAVSTIVGALVGTPLIVLFGMSGPVPLVACPVTISELCVGGYQLLLLRRVLRAGAGRREP